MSISDEPNIVMEDAPSGDMEFVTLGQDESAPPEEATPEEEKINLTKAEYEALMAKTDSAKELSSSFGQLAERLGNQGPQQVPVNVPYIAPPSDEDLERDMFVPGKTIQTLRKILAAEQAPIQGQNLMAQVQTNRRLLELDPNTKELYIRYKDDVEKKVKSLPAHLQYQPDIYERAYKEVIIEKQGEIVQSKAQEIADKAVAAALAAYGITPGAKAGTTLPRPAMQTEGAPGGAAKPKAKTVYMTQADVQDMRDRGMDPTDADQKRFYWENVLKGKGGK